MIHHEAQCLQYPDTLVYLFGAPRAEDLARG
ncbi:hypothetical protein LCGC14_2910880, partial [marine sediment metagenome]